LIHGVAFLCGISTPSLSAQGEQRRLAYFNIDRDNAPIEPPLGYCWLSCRENAAITMNERNERHDPGTTPVVKAIFFHLIRLTSLLFIAAGLGLLPASAQQLALRYKVSSGSMKPSILGRSRHLVVD
jgi:hypothetical protein